MENKSRKELDKNKGSLMLAITSFNKASWIVIDLETGDPSDEHIKAAIAAYKPPSNIKNEEKIDERKSQAADAIRKKAALLDSSPIICVALKTDFCSVIFNGMSMDAIDIDGWLSMPCGDERGLLIALRSFLDAVCTEETVIVCHNSNYDLPKARNGFLRHRLLLPLALQCREQPIFDTMRQIRYFSMENANERYVSLDTVARVLGIPQPKQVITGADCPRLHKEGRIEEVLVYCCVDVSTTERAYLLMTGQSQDLE